MTAVDSEVYKQGKLAIINKFSIDYMKREHFTLWQEWQTAPKFHEKSSEYIYKLEQFCETFSDKQTTTVLDEGQFDCFKSSWHDGLVCIYSDQNESTDFVYVMRDSIPKMDVWTVSIETNDNFFTRPFCKWDDAIAEATGVFDCFDEHEEIEEFTIDCASLNELGITNPEDTDCNIVTWTGNGGQVYYAYCIDNDHTSEHFICVEHKGKVIIP